MTPSSRRPIKKRELLLQTELVLLHQQAEQVLRQVDSHLDLALLHVPKMP